MKKFVNMVQSLTELSDERARKALGLTEKKGSKFYPAGLAQASAEAFQEVSWKVVDKMIKAYIKQQSDSGLEGAKLDRVKGGVGRGTKIEGFDLIFTTPVGEKVVEARFRTKYVSEAE